MTENIINLLNARLLTTGYFRQLYGLSELVKQDGVSYPVVTMCNGKGEKKHVSNFDEINGSCYWRRSGDISFSDIDATNNFSNNKLTIVSFPLRLIAVVNRQMMTVDGPYNAEVLGQSIYGVLNQHLNGNIRRAIGARAVYMSLNSLEDNNEKIFSVEFSGSEVKTLSDELVICALNLTVSAEILASCIGNECDLMDACEALLSCLTTAQKNECILPAYDFSDEGVLSNLTENQRNDLIEELCESSTFVYDLYVDGVDTGEDITIDGSDITINLN